jgi:hypothetical protein
MNSTHILDAAAVADLRRVGNDDGAAISTAGPARSGRAAGATAPDDIT